MAQQAWEPLRVLVQEAATIWPQALAPRSALTLEPAMEAALQQALVPILLQGLVPAKALALRLREQALASRSELARQQVEPQPG